MSSDHISGGSGDDTLIISSGDATVDLSGYGAAQPTMSISDYTSIDTITLDPLSMTTSITLPNTTYSIGSSGSYTYTTSPSYNWNNPPTVNISNNGIDMAAGTDITVAGKSLKQFMDKMEERLAILVPDPAKLEKFEALKKAYEHYKLMEKLCQELPKEEE